MGTAWTQGLADRLGRSIGPIYWTDLLGRSAGQSPSLGSPQPGLASIAPDLNHPIRSPPMPASTLLWFRNDLRLQDHALLAQAARAKHRLIPLYCFDPRQFGKTSCGFAKTGNYRAQFLLDSLADLRHNLRQRGSDLVLRLGKPEVIIPALVEQWAIDSLAYQAETTAEETRVEANLTAALRAQVPAITVITGWGSTLFHPDDLPFDLEHLPEVFTQFRKAVEQHSSVRVCVPLPEQLPPLPDSLEVGALPGLDELGLAPCQRDRRGVLFFQGGETAGQQRLQDYIWSGDHLRNYKLTRNGMKGANYSSKFSPWLALGCLSPRDLYWQVQDYEQQRIANDSTDWLIFELLWRDYFRFICAKHGNKIFKLEGLQGILLPWQQDEVRFGLWTEGMTGFPLVDANMRELKQTGFMSNRGRQNVASFLTKNLGIDWRWGAEWFESQLIDYDVCSNWGNWNYTAGVGNDARGFRFFNIQKQSRDYDPQGEYVKHWLPELQEVPAHQVHEPWTLSAMEQQRFGVTLGVDYPHPVVDLFTSARANEAAYAAACQAAPQAAAQPAPSSRRAKPQRRRQGREHGGTG